MNIQNNRRTRFLDHPLNLTQPLIVPERTPQPLRTELAKLKKDNRALRFTHPLYQPLQLGVLTIVHPEHSKTGGLFGYVRNGGKKAHHGIDIEAARGTPVLAAEEGVVTFSGQLPGYGNVIYVNHRQNYQTRYAHLQEGSLHVKVGDIVKQGQAIASSGKSGNANSPSILPHLHFEMRQIRIHTASGSIANAESHPLNPLRYITHTGENQKFSLEYQKREYIKKWFLLNR